MFINGSIPLVEQDIKSRPYSPTLAAVSAQYKKDASGAVTAWQNTTASLKADLDRLYAVSDPEEVKMLASALTKKLDKASATLKADWGRSPAGRVQTFYAAYRSATEQPNYKICFTFGQLSCPEVAE